MIEYFKHFLGSTMQEKTFRIALLEPDRYPAIEELRSGFYDQINKLNLELVFLFNVYNASGSEHEMDSIVNQLVENDADALLSIGTEFTFKAQSALRAARHSIPLMFTNVPHPDKHGIISSYAGNTENISGIHTLDHRYFERIEKIRHLFPNVRSVLIVFNPEGEKGCLRDHFLQTARDLMQINIHTIAHPLNKDSSIGSDLARNIASQQPDLIFTMCDIMAMANMKEIASVANQMKVPLVTSDAESVALGAALSYGNSSYKIGLELGSTMLEMLSRGNCPSAQPLQLYCKEFTLRANRLALMQQEVQFSTNARRWLEKHAEFVV